MTKLKSMLIILISLNAIANENPKQNDLLDGLTINVNNNFLPKSLNSLQNKSLQQTFLTNILQQITTKNNIGKRAKEIIDKSKSFTKKYKYRLIGIAALGTYSAIFYHLLRGSLYLSQKDLWSAWPQNVSFEKLLEIPQKQLSEQLIKEIQMRYINPQNPTDFIMPLVKFMHNIEKEKNYIIFYSRIHNWISKLRLSKIFPIKKKMFMDSKERLNQLAYIKNTFLSWTANFNMREFGN